MELIEIIYFKNGNYEGVKGRKFRVTVNDLGVLYVYLLKIK